jgi:hypothetical protein
MTDSNEIKTLEVSEIWKFAAAIGISCSISLFGQWVGDSSRYTTEADVEKLIAAKAAVTATEMRHQAESLTELKHVVENNNKVLTDIRTELAAMREERKVWLQHLHVKNTN